MWCTERGRGFEIEIGIEIIFDGGLEIRCVYGIVVLYFKKLEVVWWRGSGGGERRERRDEIELCFFLLL